MEHFERRLENGSVQKSSLIDKKLALLKRKDGDGNIENKARKSKHIALPESFIY